MESSGYVIGALSSIIQSSKHGKKVNKNSDLDQIFGKSDSNTLQFVPVMKPKVKVSATEGILLKKKTSGKKLKQKAQQPSISKHEKGFSPPPGVVHESVMKRKRPRHESEGTTDDEDDEPLVKKFVKDKSKEERTIYVGNLPNTVDKKILKKMFSKYGEIESVRFRCATSVNPKLPKKVAVIKNEFHPNRHTICAYVVFKDKSVAEKAIMKRNGKEYEGYHLRVDIAANAYKHDHKRSVFIGSLPFDIEEEDLWEHFSDCGQVIGVRVIRDSKTGIGKGFGYVTYESVDSVELALKLNDKKLQGRSVRVMRSIKKAKKTKEQKNTKKRITDRSQKYKNKVGVKSLAKPSNTISSTHFDKPNVSKKMHHTKSKKMNFKTKKQVFKGKSNKSGKKLNKFKKKK